MNEVEDDEDEDEEPYNGHTDGGDRDEAAAVEAGAQPRGEQLDVVRLTALREVTCSELIPCSHPEVKTAVQI